MEQPEGYSISQSAQQPQLQQLVLLWSLSSFLETAVRVQAATRACINADAAAEHTNDLEKAFYLTLFCKSTIGRLCKEFQQSQPLHLQCARKVKAPLKEMQLDVGTYSDQHHFLSSTKMSTLSTVIPLQGVLCVRGLEYSGIVLGSFLGILLLLFRNGNLRILSCHE